MKTLSDMRSKYPVLWMAGLGGLFTVVNLANAQSWQATSAPSDVYCSSVTSSADGNALVAVAYEGTVYVSWNSGTRWSQTTAPGNILFSVAASVDGTKLVAAGGPGSETGEYLHSRRLLPRALRLRLLRKKY